MFKNNPHPVQISPTRSDRPEPVSSAAASTACSEDCLSPIVFLGLLAWIILVSYIRALTTYAYSITPQTSSGWDSVRANLVQAVLIGVPVLLLALFWKNRLYRAIFRTWGGALLGFLFLLPVLLIDPLALQTQAVLHMLMSLGLVALTGLVWRRVRVQEAGSARPAGSLPTASGLALLWGLGMGLPWVAWGALGSLLDTILQTGAALGLGLALGIWLQAGLFTPLRCSSSSKLANLTLGGLAAGGAILIITSGLGYSFGGIQVLLMVALPGLGFILTGLSEQAGDRAGNWLPGALLLGLALAAPLTLIDPAELTLVSSASAGETLQWGFQAAGVSLLLGLSGGMVAAFFLWLTTLPTLAGWLRWTWLPLAAANLGAGLVLIGVYFLVGQPGFYGDGLLVILRQQADLSPAHQINDYAARRRYVYTTLVQQANHSQADIRQALNNLHWRYTPYYLENAIHLDYNPLLRRWLDGRPEVERILFSQRMRPLPRQPGVRQGDTSKPEGIPWNLKLIGADRVWQELNVTGQGIVVGQSDSGVQGDHPELAASYRGQNGIDDYNWLDPWNDSDHPVDMGGHGTHTLGSIVGQHTGVAPGATWYGCVNLARNLGNPALYLDCMQFMLAPYPRHGDAFTDGDPAQGAHVINNSWGCPALEGCDPNAFLYAVHALRSAGVFVVASAGNDGPRCQTLNTPPPIYAEVFAVGAIDRYGKLASFSSIGPVTADGSGRVKPDVVAPGVNVVSAVPGNTYAAFSGTSMAGPHVVGVVALMWSANPALIGQIEATEQILRSTTQPFTGVLPACPGAQDKPSTAVGYGVVDAYRAVQQALQWKP